MVRISTNIVLTSKQKMGDLSQGWTGRLGGTALAAAFAFGAVGSGLDRMAAKSADQTQFFPALFADASLGSAAVRHIAGEDFAKAESVATSALRRSPLEPARSGALGTARLALGKRGAADRAFRVAGELGWRDPLTQLYWLQVATARGDYDVAAERLDAVLRDNPPEAQRQDLFSGLSGTAQGQRALAKRLALNPGWRSTYFRPAADVSREELRARVAVLEQLGSKPVLGCEGGAPFADRMVSAGEPVLGARVWRSQCPEANDGLLFDPDLSRSAVRRLSPFAWETFGDGISRRDEGGIGLNIPVSFTRRFARQLVVLEPGKYTLRWEAFDQEGGPSDRVVATFGCTPNTPVGLRSVLSDEERFEASINVTAACASQYLALSLRPGNGTVELKGLALEPDY